MYKHNSYYTSIPLYFQGRNFLSFDITRPSKLFYFQKPTDFQIAFFSKYRVLYIFPYTILWNFSSTNIFLKIYKLFSHSSNCYNLTFFTINLQNIINILHLKQGTCRRSLRTDSLYVPQILQIVTVQNSRPHGSCFTNPRLKTVSPDTPHPQPASEPKRPHFPYLPYTSLQTTDPKTAAPLQSPCLPPAVPQ